MGGSWPGRSGSDLPGQAESPDWQTDLAAGRAGLRISRNGPYIGGHLAFYFKLNFKQVYNVL